MQTNEYDAIVVGAGPAGSSAAYFLGASRIPTLLIDKKSFPRQKICSGGISPRSLNLLHEMGLEDRIDSFHKIIGTRIISPEGVVVEGRIPPTDDFKQYGYVIPRYSLDKILVDNAVSTGNVEFQQGLVTDLILDGDFISGVTTGQKKINSKVVILAEGAISGLAAKYNLSRHSSERTIIGLETWRRGIDDDSMISIYYHGEVLPGYFWIFCEGGTMANVGLSVWDPSLHNNLKVRGLFNKILKSDEISHIICGSEEVQKPKLWPIRFSESDIPLVTNGAIAVGDCGGFANPLTGEGIYYALHSGKFAAETVIGSLQKNDVSTRSLSLYRRLYEREFGEDLAVSHELKILFSNKEFVNALLRKASEDEGVNRLLQGVIVNVIPKRGMLGILKYKL